MTASNPRPRLIRACAAVAAALSIASSGARAQTPVDTTLAAVRMSAPGVEATALAKGIGTWSVVTTMQLSRDAKPMVIPGLTAERSMVGTYQQEIMRPASGSKVPDFRRIAFLTYDRVEGRWQYVSLDTRAPVGIMPAFGSEKAVGNKLTLQFENLAVVGGGKEVEGRMVHSNLVITHLSDDHELIQQFWTQADGTGRHWLAVQYDYTRAH
jgi:hypothetical protein